MTDKPAPMGTADLPTYHGWPPLAPRNGAEDNTKPERETT